MKVTKMKTINTNKKNQNERKWHLSQQKKSKTNQKELNKLSELRNTIAKVETPVTD